jgi:hypothetical protein
MKKSLLHVLQGNCVAGGSKGTSKQVSLYEEIYDFSLCN